MAQSPVTKVILQVILLLLLLLLVVVVITIGRRGRRMGRAWQVPLGRGRAERIIYRVNAAL